MFGCPAKDTGFAVARKKPPSTNNRTLKKVSHFRLKLFINRTCGRIKVAVKFWRVLRRERREEKGGHMALYVRKLTPQEEKVLRKWLKQEDEALRHRAHIILLSYAGYRVPEIAAMLNAHPTNLRKWIHRFNQRGLQGLISPRSGGAPPRFTEEQKRQIIELARTHPRDLGLPYSRWTLHKLAEEAVKRGIVESISHEYVRQILKKAGVNYRFPARSYQWIR